MLVARVTSDVETLARFTQWGLISWIIDTAIIVGTIAVMLWYSWPLTLLVLVIHVPLVPFLRWVQRSQFVSYGKVRSRVAETLGHVSEAVTGAQVIRAYGYGEPVRERLDDAIERQFAQQQRSQVWFACMLPVVDVVSSISLAVAVGIGVWYRDDLGLEVGELVAFCSSSTSCFSRSPRWVRYSIRPRPLAPAGGRSCGCSTCRSRSPNPPREWRRQPVRSRSNSTGSGFRTARAHRCFATCRSPSRPSRSWPSSVRPVPARPHAPDS